MTQIDPQLQKSFDDIWKIFSADPEAAVRSQAFIKRFHHYIADHLTARLTPQAVKSGIRVIEEAKIFGSFKSKDVDVAVVHPTNGPMILVGVRSQMSSVGKNVLTYYQDIVGEAISLQERFPMCTTGYAYVHPLEVVPWQKKNGSWVKRETPNHPRYAKMYAGIASRDDRLYKHLAGSYDQFAYSVVDFQTSPAVLMDDIIREAVPTLDMSITTFIDRLVNTFTVRNIWMDDVFISFDQSLTEPNKAGDDNGAVLDPLV